MKRVETMRVKKMSVFCVRTVFFKKESVVAIRKISERAEATASATKSEMARITRRAPGKESE